LLRSRRKLGDFAAHQFDGAVGFPLEFCGFAAGWSVWHVFRPIIGLQFLCTAAVTLLSAWLAGLHGAISAALGGLIGIIAGLAFAVLAARSKSKSAGEALYAALRAELVKVALMVILLWIVLATYRDVVAIGLIGTFIATILIFTMAILVREK
jgi:ATP synthase protein I